MNEENTETVTAAIPDMAGDPTIEELSAENETLRNQIRMREAAYEIETALQRAGARSPNLLIESAKASFQFGEDGKLVNPAGILDHLRRTYPEQFGAASIDAGAGRSSGPTLTKDALSRMSAAEIQRLDWAEVRAVLSER